MAAANLDNTFGAMLIGLVVSTGLFGVICTQSLYYFQTYQDPPLVKLTVATLLILENAHTVLYTYIMYSDLITNFGNPVGLQVETKSGIALVVVSAIITFVVHLFYARRVWFVSLKNKYLVALIVMLTTTHFGLGIYTTVLLYKQRLFTWLRDDVAAIDAALIMAVCADVAIAGSLTYYLQTRKSGIKQTDATVNRLMSFAINNGIVTSVMDLLVIIFATTQIHNLIFWSIFLVVPKVYTNSMLATLNSRQSRSSRVSQPIAFLYSAETSIHERTRQDPEDQRISEQISQPPKVHLHSSQEYRLSITSG